MIPQRQSLQNTLYDCGTNMNKPTFGWKGEHFQLTHEKARCDVTTTDNAGRKQLQGNITRSGEAVFLPYQNNRICSVLLRNPTPTGGARFFFTSAMHGCRFFVDSIRGSKDVIVYHANAIAQDPGGAGRDPNSQLPACVNELRDMHQRAQNDWGAKGLKTIIEFGKPDYFAGANPIVALKQEKVDRRIEKWDMGIRHRDVFFAGRCFVCAYPFGDQWSFYYQTWGEVKYRRPKGVKNVIVGLVTGHWNYVHKLRTRGSEEVVRDMGVLEWGRVPRA